MTPDQFAIIISLTLLIAVVIFAIWFTRWHIRSDRQFKAYMYRSQDFRQNFLDPIVGNYTAIESGKADLEIAFYVPLAGRETALSEAVHATRLVFPTATLEPSRTYIELGGKEVPVLKVVLDARQRLSQEQRKFLSTLPMRATVINNK